MNSKYKLLASNTIIFAIGNILVKLISFFLMPLYTSVLTTAQYGVAELLNNTIEIVLPIATLCIIEALYRFSIDEDSDHSTLLMNSFAVVFAGDILVGLGCLVWFFVFGYQYALHFFVLYLTTTFYKLSTQFARGLGHVKRYVLYGVLNSLLLVSTNIILLLFLRGGIAAYLASFSVAYGIAGIFAFVLSKEYQYFSTRKLNVVRLREMLEYSLPSIPNMLSWWVNSLSDRYILLFFWGAGVAGLYTAASKLPAMINLVTSIFQQAWQYSTAVEIRDKNSKSFFSNVFRVYTYFCVTACVCLVFINKIICRILLQADFYVAWKFVPLLLLAATFGCIATYFGTFYNAMKNNTMLMVSTLVGAIGNVILNFTLIPTMGGVGAAIATAVSYFVVMIIRMVNVRKYVDIDIDIYRFLIQFVILTIAVVFSCFQGAMTVAITGIAVIIIVLSDINMLRQGVGMIRKL